jgi:DNA-binding response OmpR family regulator
MMATTYRNIPVAFPETSKPFAADASRWYNDGTKSVRPASPYAAAEEKPGMIKILIVDDDRPSLKMTGFLLREEGYSVFTADNGHDALRMIDEKTPDLLILDVMMPGMDGWEVTRQLRRTTNLPIIILSAKGETTDRVFGLDLGADDYLAKPFEPSELLARVRAVLRRAEAFTFGEPQTQLSVEGFRLDPVNNTVALPGNRVVELTPIEFRLLHYLARNNGRVLTHEQLLNTVWGYEYEGYSNQVAVYIRRLRSKLEPNPDEPRHILTARGIGYRFETGN